MLLALLPLALSAEPLLGLDFVPFGRGDLVWVDEEQSSGTLVGEFDGLLRPPVSLYGGLSRDKSSWLFGLGLARVSQVTWTGEERRKQVAMAVRPTVDWQRYLLPREPEKPTLWVGAGAHLVIPWARDVSSAYTDEEAEAVQEGVRDTMARIGGYGGRLGVGADYLFDEHLALGLRAHWVQHRGQSFQEDSLVVSALSWGEAGVRLQVAF